MPNDLHKVLDRIFNSCEYCGEVDHTVADCPDLADWRHRERLQDMLAEAAYYQVPKEEIDGTN